MEDRNRYIIENGQRDAVSHACDKCLRIYEMDTNVIRESYYFDVLSKSHEPLWMFFRPVPSNCW
jgi:hypothetical protein